VPSGALTALPFHLLVTEKPAVAVPQVNSPRDLAAYRGGAWLWGAFWLGDALGVKLVDEFTVPNPLRLEIFPSKSQHDTRLNAH
jgi:hypothetical protein